jgi:two-component system phosphate regulon sensor histidine kinase PhoR
MRRALFLRLAGITVLAVALLTLIAARLLAPGRLPGLFVAAALVLVVALALDALVARSIARPMKDLGAALRRVGSGDFEARVAPARRGELRELGTSFNEMVFRTKTMVAESREGREALDAIVGAISEGLMVVDRDGRVILANASLCAIAGEMAPVGRFHWEVFREPALVELLNATAAGPNSACVTLDGREYEASSVRLAESGRTVLTLHDVTDISRAATLKRELVTSVSHELRTPLTAIKGYVETLEETAAPDARRYLEIISRNTDRLIALVGDLLTLSEMEEAGAQLSREPTDLRELAARTIGQFERRAREKGLELRLDAPDDLPRADVDAFKLEQVLTNLLDNAVKCTERGSVTVRLAATGGRFTIAVADTGPGIAREHLPRIFERFYVVDKSRSRQLGGTGLGLAIVKHIVLLHEGEVAVDSTPGTGTTFTITIPAA